MTVISSPEMIRNDDRESWTQGKTVQVTIFAKITESIKIASSPELHQHILTTHM